MKLIFDPYGRAKSINHADAYRSVRAINAVINNKLINYIPYSSVVRAVAE